MRKKQELNLSDHDRISMDVPRDQHEQIEKLRALSSISTGAIAQRDQLAKWNEDALKKIHVLEAECRSLERERDAARAVASDLMEQLRRL